jgi:hypothetical protein
MYFFQCTALPNVRAVKTFEYLILFRALFEMIVARFFMQVTEFHCGKKCIILPTRIAYSYVTIPIQQPGGVWFESHLEHHLSLRCS